MISERKVSDRDAAVEEDRALCRLKAFMRRIGVGWWIIRVGSDSMARTLGDYRRAQPLLEQSLAMQKKLLGEEHPDVATGLNNLALLYQEQGKYAKAEPLFEQSLAILKKTLPPDHSHIAIVERGLEGVKQAHSVKRSVSTVAANNCRPPLLCAGK